MRPRRCSVCHRTGHDARRHQRRNPDGAGYLAGSTFHPIRAWSGYDPAKVGEKPKGRKMKAKQGTASERTEKAGKLLGERTRRAEEKQQQTARRGGKRAITFGNGSQIEARIGFEDTEERAILKAAGFQYNSLSKRWSKRPASRDDVKSIFDTLLGRGYVTENRNAEVDKLLRFGIDPRKVHLVQSDRGDDRVRPIPGSTLTKWIAEAKKRNAARAANRAKP